MWEEKYSFLSPHGHGEKVMPLDKHLGRLLPRDTFLLKHGHSIQKPQDSLPLPHLTTTSVGFQRNGSGLQLNAQQKHTFSLSGNALGSPTSRGGTKTRTLEELEASGSTTAGNIKHTPAASPINISSPTKHLFTSGPPTQSTCLAFNYDNKRLPNMPKNKRKNSKWHYNGSLI